MVWEEISCMILAVICLAMAAGISNAFRTLPGKSGWVISLKLMNWAIYGYTDLSVWREISMNFFISTGEKNTGTPFRIRYKEVK